MSCCSCQNGCCIFLCGERGKLYSLRIIGTCCGGIKFDDGQKGLGKCQSIWLQILISALQVAISSVIFIEYYVNQFSVGEYIGTLSAVYFIGTLFMSLIAYNQYQTSLKGEDQDQKSCLCCYESLTKIKSKKELIFACITSAISGACMGYLSYFDNGSDAGGDNYSLGFAMMLMTPLYMNVYFGRAPFQSAIYDYENEDIGIYSMKYSRPGYVWILAFLKLVINPSSLLFQNLMILLPVFFSFAMVSNPFVTLFYAVQQIEIIIFGNTPRVNDLRLVISFTVNSVVVGIAYLVLLTVAENQTPKTDKFWAGLFSMNIILFLGAVLGSFNYLDTFSIGKIKRNCRKVKGIKKN